MAEKKITKLSAKNIKQKIVTHVLYVKNGSCSVQVSRSARRKNASIIIHRDNRIELRVPARYTQKQTEALLQEKKNWIEKVLAKNRLVPNAPERRYCQGEKILFLGRELSLVFSAPADLHHFSKSAYVFWEKKLLVLPLSAHNRQAEKVKKKLLEFYRAQSLLYFQKRIAELTPLLGEKKPSLIKTRVYKGRWGSCNTHREISLNLFLLMAPTAVIDYVLLHELAHLYQLNHSPLFWQKVAEGDPHYKTHRKFLKENAELFRF